MISAGTHTQFNFFCSIGYGNPDASTPRNPRLTLEEARHFE
jgi:hypothetical protein